MLVFCVFCGCVPVSFTNNFINSLDKETENNYTFVGTYGVSINVERYEYLSSAQSLVNWNEQKDQGYVACFNSLDDKAVFTYVYDSKQVNTGNKGQHVIEPYYYKHDIGLFSLDYSTGKCELVKDLKGVYSESLYSPYPGIIKRIADDKYGILIYDGILEVFDFDSNTTTFSKAIYDKTQAAEIGKYDQTAVSGFLDSDYYRYVPETQTLYYYLYESGSYISMEYSNFTHLRGGQIARIGDMILSFEFITNNNISYGSVVFLGSEQNLSKTELDQLVNQYMEEQKYNSYRQLSIGGKIYENSIYYNGNELKDLETGDKITFDHAFFSSNPVFHSVEEFWKKEVSSSAQIDIFEIIAAHHDKLIVGCKENTAWRNTVPMLVFEVDLTDNSVLYIGCPQIGDIVKVL